MEIIEDGKHIARKEHKCNFCHGVINIGEEYEYQKNKHDGEFYTWKAHIKCSELATVLNMYDSLYDEGLTDNDFYEYISEAISDLSLKEKIDILYELKIKTKDAPVLKFNYIAIAGVICKLSENYKIDGDYVLFECNDYSFYNKLQNILYEGKAVQVVYGEFNFYRKFSKMSIIRDNKYNMEIEIFFEIK